MIELLTADEIDALTAPLVQRHAQTRHLERMLGCPLQRRPDGLPVVTRDMLRRLEGGRERKPEQSGIKWSK